MKGKQVKPTDKKENRLLRPQSTLSQSESRSIGFSDRPPPVFQPEAKKNSQKQVGREIREVQERWNGKLQMFELEETGIFLIVTCPFVSPPVFFYLLSLLSMIAEPLLFVHRWPLFFLVFLDLCDD